MATLKINCPICNHDDSKKILELKTGNFDQSTLYTNIKIYTCLNCGHIFNYLSADEINGLFNYYQEEKALSNANSQDKQGDIPGSNNPKTISRYQDFFSFIKKYLSKEAQILDLGFSKGGFIKFLKEQGYQNSFDIDVVDNYLSKNQAGEAIPFADNSFDFFILDRVVDHLVDPAKAIREARRVLKPGGILCLGISDASRYDKNYFFDFYWFLLREHTQHFDLTHINLLANQENFELIDKIEDDTVMMNETMVMPALNLIFRLSDKPINETNQADKFILSKQTENYINNNLSKLKIRQEFFNGLSEKQQPLYVWGIGREFFYLYEMAGLKHCNIKGLIDTNPYKQKSLTVDGSSIQSEEILKQANESAGLLITAMAHSDIIKTGLQQKDYKMNYLTFNR